MRFITLKKEQNTYSKCFVFASSALLHLFFTSLCSFVDRGRKIIPFSRAQGTLATSLCPNVQLGLLITLQTTIKVQLLNVNASNLLINFHISLMILCG